MQTTTVSPAPTSGTQSTSGSRIFSCLTLTMLMVLVMCTVLVLGVFSIDKEDWMKVWYTTNAADIGVGPEVDDNPAGKCIRPSVQEVSAQEVSPSSYLDRF